MQTQIIITAQNTAKKQAGTYFSCDFRHVKKVSVKLKIQSRANFSSSSSLR